MYKELHDPLVDRVLLYAGCANNALSFARRCYLFDTRFQCH